MNYVKQIICTTGLLLAVGSASADQCQLIAADQAARALDHIKPASEYKAFCEPCGDKDFWKQDVKTVTELKVLSEEVGGQTYWGVWLNGRNVDLAYTFVRKSDGSYLNLSKLADCPSGSVSAGFSAPEVEEVFHD